MSAIIGMVGLYYLGLKIGEGIDYIGDKYYTLTVNIKDKISTWKNSKRLEHDLIQLNQIKSRHLAIKEKYGF